MFRILSLDGGGLRGSFGAGFLAAVERRLPAGRTLSGCFDLLAGTSTGGILSAGLAAGLSAADLVDFYRRRGPDIFPPRPKFTPRTSVRPIFPLANWLFKRKTGGAMDDLFRARYCPDALLDSFQEAFGAAKIGDVYHDRGSKLIVPAMNLSRGRVHIFRTPHLPDGALPAGVVRNRCDPCLQIADVLVAATAAPTYFPHKVIGGEAYCDGGVFANNPTVLAVAEAVALATADDPDEPSLVTIDGGPGTAEYEDHENVENRGPSDFQKAVDVQGVEVLSVGTGRMNHSLSPPGGDAGMLYWARHIADVMGNGMQQGAELPAEFFLGRRLTSVNFDIPDASYTLDAHDKIEHLFELGAAAAEDHGDRVLRRFVPAAA